MCNLFWHRLSDGVRCAVLAALVMVVCPMRGQINTDQVLVIGRNALYFEDYVLAIQYFNQAIAAKPYLAQPYFYRAIAKINLDDYDGAEADASQALELNPFLSDAWEVRGVARQNLGKDSLAVLDYDHALELLPRNRQILFNKAMAQIETGDHSGADSTFTNLIDYYPLFENARLGHARLNMVRGDTVGALDDIDAALKINPRSFNSYAMRADIYISRGRVWHDAARADLDSALRLQPRNAGLYVNRAFLKYTGDDYFGAMADYDHALELEPYNRMALYNRALLNAEVSAYDRALEDFNKVIQLDPTDVRSRYNRSIILARKHQFKEAIDDINYVIEDNPDFPTGYYMRSRYYEQWGKQQAARSDRQRADMLNSGLRADSRGRVTIERDSVSEPTPEEVARKEFATLLTVADNTSMTREYNNTSIRGKVQDADVAIELEPMVELAYYSSPTELRQETYYIKEVADLNDTRALRHVVMVTDRVVPLNDEEAIARHFRSIQDYNSYLSSHKPRAVDYIGRALDFMTVRDYASAVTDLTRAIDLTPSFAPAYMMRAQARIGLMSMPQVAGDVDFNTRQGLESKAYDDIMSDLDKAIELIPNSPYVWYNRANMLARLGQYDRAIADYNRALALKKNYGQAYYNRGYCRLKAGAREAAVGDLSRAGELGVVAAYNLLKRMRK